METKLSRLINKMFHGGIYEYKYCIVCKKITRHRDTISSNITGIYISRCCECIKKEQLRKEK